MSKTVKPTYKIKNWNEYENGLRMRGSLTFWITEDVLENWVVQKKTGKRGASNYYSDTAIATMATVKNLFNLAGRQSEGFLASIFELMAVSLDVPDHTTLSRRLGKLKVDLPVKYSNRPRHIVVDSTGVKVFGEGEWKVRQHGYSKRRTWRKLHLGVDEASGEIVAAIFTTNDVHDSEVLENLLEDIEAPIAQVSGDGAYDSWDNYEIIQKRGAKVAIPPRAGSKIKQHGNCKAKPLMRDENLRQIRAGGRKAWKVESNYHRRSIAETTMFRLKTIFGGTLKSRNIDNQAAELLLQCQLLNRMVHLCKPETDVVF